MPGSIKETIWRLSAVAVCGCLAASIALWISLIGFCGDRLVCLYLILPKPQTGSHFRVDAPFEWEPREPVLLTGDTMQVVPIKVFLSTCGPYEVLVSGPRWGPREICIRDDVAGSVRRVALSDLLSPEEATRQLQCRDYVVMTLTPLQ